tara:strand:+ start:2269 stop:2757 length:489 start_codon:yes stop_codon:yes gene_type:complete
LSNIKNFILDVDGVMTSGKFLYSTKGKIYKEFGAHDSDGLKILSKYINIGFITADRRGLGISKSRISKDMGFKLTLVPEENRYEFFKAKFGFKNTIYMADGIYDAKILKECHFSITPNNARKEAKKYSDYITPSNSAEGAVLDACIKIMKRFFKHETYKYPF